MDVEIINDENESPTRKLKSKQLTLFDMKSKFTVKSSAGGDDLSDALAAAIARSPSPLKPLQSVLNTKRAVATVGKSKSKSKAAATPVEDVVKTFSDEENGENVENNEPSVAATAAVVNTPVNKTKKSKMSKLQAKSPNLLEYFGGKTQSTQATATTEAKEEEETEATKPKQRKLTATTQKQVKFNQAVKDAEVVAVAAGPATVADAVVQLQFMSSSDIDLARMNLKQRIQSIGTMALDSTGSLKNWMFGEMASIIECYNTIMQYCKEPASEVKKKEAAARRGGRKKRPRRVKKDKNSQQQQQSEQKSNRTMTSLDLYAIDYEQLVESIDKFDEADTKYRNEFYRLVRNLLFFFVKMDGLFEDKCLFGVSVAEVPLHDESLLQEMCRLVILTLSERETNKNWHLTEYAGLIHSRDYLTQKVPILKELEENKSGLAFGELRPEKKLELLRVLCDFLLLSKKYEAIKQEEESQIETTTRRKQSNLDSLITCLKISDEEFSKNRRKYLAEAKKSQSLVVVRAFEKYDKSLKRIQELRDNVKALERLEPIGFDFESNTYWSFSFFKGLVVEIKSENDRESKWLLFSNKKSSQSLLDFLRSTLKCGELVKDLKTLVDSLFQDEVESASTATDENQVDEKKIEEKKNDQDVDMEEEDLFDDETEGGGSKTRYMTRNMARKDVLNALMNGKKSSSDEESEDDDTTEHGDDNEDDDDNSIELSGDVDSFEHYIPWIDALKGDNRLKNFQLYLSNVARLIYFSGLATKDDYQTYKTKLASTTTTTSNEEMFELNRRLMIDILGLIANKMHLKMPFSFQKLSQDSESKLLVECCKEFLQATSSFSGLCLMLYFFLCNIKWGMAHKSKKCGICSSKLTKYKMIHEQLEQVGEERTKEQEEEEKLGQFVCMRCYAAFHKQCVLDNAETYEFTTNENLVCAGCKAKKQTYVMEELAPVDEEEKAEEEEDRASSNGDRRRRNVKEVNYSEIATTTTTRQRRKNPASASSSFATADSSTTSSGALSRSHSNSSIESLSAFNYKPQSVYQTRSGRASKPRFAQAEPESTAAADVVPAAVSTRTSQRSRGSVKKYVYDDDEDGQDDEE